MKTSKPFASISLDLDNQWSYMKTHGDPGWETFPTYLDQVVPAILSFLTDLDLKITFFLVGQDAALEKNYAALQSIVDAGHEIGNHSFKHEPWLHRYSEDEINEDLSSAENAISRFTDQKIRGFRGPGYSISEATIRVLSRRGYLYDASTLPTFIGPLARLYYFASTRLTEEEKAQRSKLFGTFREGFRPLRPHYIRSRSKEGENTIIEIPVTTMPVFRVPIHSSYVLYLSSISPPLGLMYFRLALLLTSLYRHEPSLLLHPLDFMDKEQVPELSFFPAMALPSSWKIEVVQQMIRMVSSRYRIGTLGEHAQLVEERTGTQIVEAKFDTGVQKTY